MLKATCVAASDLALLENLEQQLHAEISVGSMAELERELLRLRLEMDPLEWQEFCSSFSNRRLYKALSVGTLTGHRPEMPSVACPAQLMEVALADSFKAREFAIPSKAHVINAWEYSLPASRSLRGRKVCFSHEIAEVVRTAVKPRILILGGRLREAEDAIHSAHLQHAQFVALADDAKDFDHLRSKYRAEVLQIESGTLENLRGELGFFDLIYSPGWLESSDDAEAVAWLGEAVEMLRTGGRLLAANFAPGSRDAGWMEACWNWHPHYRSEEDLASLSLELKQPAIRGHAVFRDASGASVFLEIHSL